MRSQREAASKRLGELGRAAEPFLRPALKTGLSAEAAERVEDGELAGGAKERLVVVRAVNIDERFAEGGESGEGGRRTVDELAGDAGRGAVRRDIHHVAFLLQPLFDESGDLPVVLHDENFHELKLPVLIKARQKPS